MQPIYPILLSTISVSLGLSGLYFNIKRLREAKSEVQKRQQEAVEDLRDLIRRPIMSHRPVSGLVTPSFIRSNALAVAMKRSCGKITIPMMGEAIRWVSLDLQQHYTGQQLKARLDVLNQALKELDAEMPPLLSLASSDPLAGYYFGQMFLLLLLSVITVIFAVVFAMTGKAGYLVASLLPLSVYAYFYLASTRAVRLLSIPASCSVDALAIKRCKDFFLFLFLSPSKAADLFWNGCFGPLWEQPLIMLRTPGGFVGMHGYRFLAVRVVNRELRNLQAQILRMSLTDVTPSNDVLDRLQLLFDQLWVLTGDNSLQTTKERWKYGPPH